MRPLDGPVRCALDLNAHNAWKGVALSRFHRSTSCGDCPVRRAIFDDSENGLITLLCSRVSEPYSSSSAALRVL
jgi:hypothetical protein